MAGNEMGHRSEEITAYLSETLEPEEKTAFEAHLATCEECQREVEAQRALFGEVNEALVFKRKRSIDEQVARFEAEVATERLAAAGGSVVSRSAESGAGARAPSRAKMGQRRWAVPASVALAASAAGVFLLLQRSSRVGSDTVAQQGEDAGTGAVSAPRPPQLPDGGLDGGSGTFP